MYDCSNIIVLRLSLKREVIFSLVGNSFEITTTSFSLKPLARFGSVVACASLGHGQLPFHRR